MKVFISADIEGVSTVQNWDECTVGKPGYSQAADMMTREVLAVCEGAIDAGADEITIIDAHAGGTNIDPARLPACARLIRGRSGHPHMMVEGVDGSFDAAMFVGYHSAAGTGGNPLEHTLSSSRVQEMRLNGEIASEFTLYSLAAAREGVPSVLLSGDLALINATKGMHPCLLTVATKECYGGAVTVYSPETVLRELREKAARALGQELSGAKIAVPRRSELLITFRRHTHALKASYYPGAVLVSPAVVRYASDSYFEILRALQFMVY